MATTRKPAPRKPAAKKAGDANVVEISRRRRKATPAARTHRGRPTLLDDDSQQAIVSAIRVGNHLGTAAMFSGVAASTAYSWMARGRAERDRLEELRSHGEDPRADPEEDRYLEFLERVEEAEAAAEVFAVSTIRRAIQGTPEQRDERGNLIAAAIPGDWKAALRFLELRHRHWSRRQELEVNVGGVPGRPVMIEVEERQRAEVILAVLQEAGAAAALAPGAPEYELEEGS